MSGLRVADVVAWFAERGEGLVGEAESMDSGSELFLDPLCLMNDLRACARAVQDEGVAAAIGLGRVARWRGKKAARDYWLEGLRSELVRLAWSALCLAYIVDEIAGGKKRCAK